jgi:transcription antitermination factor NusG
MDTVIPWVILQTKSGRERRVEYLLTHKGYECFLPTHPGKRRLSNRVVDVELPLFPTYVFCRFSPSAVGKAVSTPGVTHVVKFGGLPAEVAVEEIKALQLLTRSGILCEPCAYTPNGTLVQVKTGPLAGAYGIYCQDEDRRRLVISVTLLQQSVVVQLEENAIISPIERANRGNSEISAKLDLARLMK